MFVCILNNDSVHIVDYEYGDGHVMTICGSLIKKNKRDVTFSADNTFSLICKNCKDYKDEDVDYALEKYPEFYRSMTYSSILRKIKNPFIIKPSYFKYVGRYINKYNKYAFKNRK